MPKSFSVGTRVRYCGSPVLGPSTNAIGTVALVAGVRGKSVHPDPSKLMTFVDWDNEPSQGVFTHQLERIPDDVLVALPKHITALTGFELLRIGARTVKGYPSAMDHSVSVQMTRKAAGDVPYEDMAFMLKAIKDNSHV